MERARPLACGLIVMLAAGVLGGCQTGRLQEERDALWAENQEHRQKNARLEAQLAALDAERNRLASENAQLQDDLIKARSSPVVLTQPAPLPAAANTGFNSIEGVETIQGAGTITVRVPGDVLFSPGKIALKDSARKTLDQIAAVIKRDYGGNTIRVEGYTDTDPIRKSAWADNLELSLQRSAAVHRYLQEKGVNPKHMYAAGYGQHKPRSSKAKSRRVEIVVVLNG